MRALVPIIMLACTPPPGGDDSVPLPDTGDPPVDLDGDGWSADEDCDDTDDEVHPGAEEIAYDGVDQDCDGTDLNDVDGDGWAATEAGGEDCDDADADAYPGASEIPYDGIDQDCDGTDPTDVDGDGWDATEAGGEDCDDSDADVSPDATEICEGTTDEDCSGQVDEGCAAAESWSLSGADVVLYGTTNGAAAGWSVAAAGDVDGDGYGDILVGAVGGVWPDSTAFGDDWTGYPSGASMVVRGPVVADLDLTDADAWIQGAYGEARDRFNWTGASVAGVGDSNGDGYDDILVGAPYAFEDWPTEDDHNGAAVLFHGPVSGIYHTLEADAMLFGDEWYGVAGWSVSSAGDVDGDGNDDIMIGDPGYYVSGWGGAGQVAVFLGPVSGYKMLSRADALFDGAEAVSSGVGSAVASAGDVDGDGLDDILIGAAEDHGIGVGLLFLAPLAEDIAREDAHLELYGVEDCVDLGASVAGAGDVDADGYADILVGAPKGQISGDRWSGQVHLVLGDHRGGPEGVIDSSDSSAILYATDRSTLAGSRMDGGSDVDGDGHADFLVGSGNSRSLEEIPGASWLVLGPVSGVADLDDVAATRFEAEGETDEIGWSVAFAGDQDLDGLDDILIGAPGESTNGANAGAAYLVFGSSL